MAGRFTVETRFNAVDNTSGVIGGIEKRIHAMERGLSGPAKFADKTIGAAKQVGAAIAYTGIAAAGAGLAFAQAIAPGADFDEAMSAVGAVSLMARDQVSDLEAKARELGKTTGFSATQVANGMELMGKAGFTNSQILQGIAPILHAAGAEGIEFAETAGIVSNVMKGMGLDLSETGRVADVLTLASARTNSSISSLGESMAIVAPTARQLRVPLEDAVSAVAMLQDVGIDASTSGSAVATMLTNLSKPTAAIASQMHAMGVSFQDAHGDMLPFKDVVAQLAKAGQKAGGNMAQVAFFADLVGLRGQKAALNLKDLTRPMAALNAELQRAAGSAEKMDALRLDNFKGDWKKLGNLASDVGIDFFDLVKGPLRDAAQATRGWLSDNQELIKSDVAGWVKGIVDNIGPMRENIEKAVKTVDNFKDGLVAAFEDNRAVKAMGWALGKLFGEPNDPKNPSIQAFIFGERIGQVAGVLLDFIFLAKGAQAAVWAFGGAMKVAKAGSWILDLGLAAKDSIGLFNTALKAGGTFGESLALGAPRIVQALDAMAKPFGWAADGARALSSALGGGTGLVGVIATAVGPTVAIAAAIVSVGTALYNLKKLTDESGGLGGIGEDLAGGVWGAFGSGTKSWGVNGFLEGYAATDDARKNLDAARSFKGSTPEWTSKSAASAASDLTGFGRGYGATSNVSGVPSTNYAAAFGFSSPSTVVTPQVAPRRDEGAAAQAQSNQQLQQTLQQLNAKLGGGTIKLILPKGVTAEVSGAPGVEVNQSGGF